MYIGSVRFYKHLILVTIILIITSLFLSVLILHNKCVVLQQALERNSVPVTTSSSLLLNTNVANASESAILPYQDKYPDLYAAKSMGKKSAEPSKVVYLTFDDGPSARTMEILDILDRHNAKATFFVVKKDNEFSNNIYKEIVNRGHTIGLHGASHNYTQIYNSVEDFLDDLNQLYLHLETVTGIKPALSRFPGGSINPYNVRIHEELLGEMLRRGFIFHDWNVSSGDADSGATSNSIYNNVVQKVRETNKSVVLFHDSANKMATVAAMDKIIIDLQSSGFVFAALDANVAPYTFSYIK